MVRELVEDHEAVARTIRSVFAVADEAGDQPTVDLLTQRLQIHEKTAWMLRSLLEGLAKARRRLTSLLEHSLFAVCIDLSADPAVLARVRSPVRRRWRMLSMVDFQLTCRSQQLGRCSQFVRWQRPISALLGLVCALLLYLHPSAALAASGEAPVDPTVLAKAVDQMEQLDRMRISLASSLEGSTEEPTMDTMREVCMPVGKRAVAIGQENGWGVRQVASKYRNPDHAPAGPQEAGVIDLFTKHPEITGLWEPATAEQGAGVNYYRRIDVQASCLACHGSKDSRPAFVKDKYPNDKAFNFKPGDLRGMYAVYIPEVQAALAAQSP